MFSLNQGGLFFYLFPNGTPKEGESNTAYYLTYIGFLLAMICISYLLGSLNSSIIISKLIYHDDIRKHGSGNAGLTNTLRTYGKSAALMTLLGDILKTAIAIFIGGVLFGFWYAGGISRGEGMCYVAGLFAVLGHIFPIYYKFKGGKGVLATATMALILSPVVFLILFALFVIIVAISKYVSLGSVCCAFFYPIFIHSYLALVLHEKPHGLISLSTITIVLIIIWFHKENLKRIGERTERKLSFKKKPEVEKPINNNDKNG